MNKDAYYYDDGRKVAIGKKSGEIFILCTPVEVSVRRASKSDSQIDFSYIKRLDKNNKDKEDKKSKRR